MGEPAVQEPTVPATTETGATTALDRPLNRTGAMSFGAAPRNFDEAWRMAGILAESSLVPKGYQGKPGDILVAMQYGMEIGLPPMASLQSVAVINGKPGVYSDGFLAVIQASAAYNGHEEFYELGDGTQVKALRKADYENDETRAVSRFWRKGRPEPFEGSFSIGEAKRAKLWGKEGPWAQYPQRQLLWRARGYAGRNGFSAELRGIKTVEELYDLPPEETTGAPSGPPAPPVRRSEKVGTAVPADPGEIAPAPTPAVSEPDAPAATAATDENPAGTGKTAAAAEKASAPDAVSAGPGQITKSVRITDTQVIDQRTKGGSLFYEIRGESGLKGKPAPTVWHTTDEQLYRMASSCVGSDTPFTLTWNDGTTKDGKKDVRIITGLSAEN